MYSFQKDKIEEYLPNHDSHSKATDDDKPIDINSLPRGYGGVSTIWKKGKFQPRLHKDGSNRIVVAQFGSLVLINVYMPCRGAYSNTDFLSEIDQIEEICQKFATSHLVIAGDFNVDIIKSNDTRVKYFKKFMSTNKLKEAYSLPTATATFRHHNGKHSSKIDYILINDSLREATSAMEYRVLDQDPLNTSTHSPLLLKLTLKNAITRKSQAEKRNWIGKPLWGRCDVDSYVEKISKYLDTEIQPESPDIAIKYLTSAILKATSEHVPHSKPRQKTAPWNPTIAQCLRDSRTADAQWKQASKPPPHIPCTYAVEKLKKDLDLRKESR